MGNFEPLTRVNSSSFTRKAVVKNPKGQIKKFEPPEPDFSQYPFGKRKKLEEEHEKFQTMIRRKEEAEAFRRELDAEVPPPHLPSLDPRRPPFYNIYRLLNPKNN